MSTRPRRRALLRPTTAGIGAVALVSALLGCTNPDNGASAGDGTADADARVIEHAYGSTTVTGDPQRVIALGQTDIDALVALGTPPIAVGAFSGDWYSPLHPWNEDAFDEEPEYLSFDEYSIEEIMALEPDLITAVMGGMTEKEYEKLSKVAPVIAQPVGFTDWNAPFDVQTRMIATALGEDEQETAEELIQDVESSIAAAAEENSDLAGRTVAIAESWGDTFNIIGPTTPRSQFFSDLGLDTLPALDELVGDRYSADISSEKLSMIDQADLVLWTTDGGEVENLKKNAVVAPLRTTTEGRALWSTGMKTDSAFWAMDWGTVLSLPYALDTVIPQIRSALDDDPATVVTNFSD